MGILVVRQRQYAVEDPYPDHFIRVSFQPYARSPGRVVIDGHQVYPKAEIMLWKKMEMELWRRR